MLLQHSLPRALGAPESTELPETVNAERTREATLHAASTTTTSVYISQSTAVQVQLHSLNKQYMTTLILL